MAREQSTSGVQVISRVARILRLLGQSADPYSLGGIAQELDLPRSTVQRLVNALCDEGLLRAGTTGRGFRLAPDFFAGYPEPDEQIMARFRPLLEEICERTKETVDLSIFRDGRMLFLDQVQGTQRLRAVSSVGDSFPLSSTACGRACLSALPPEQAVEIVTRELGEPEGSQAVEAVLATARNARSNGFASDHNEHTEGISAVGVLVSAHPRSPIAVSVPVPTSRFERVEQAIVQTLLAAQKSQEL